MFRRFFISVILVLLAAPAIAMSPTHKFRVGEEIFQSLTMSLGGRNVNAYTDHSVVRIQIRGNNGSLVLVSTAAKVNGGNWSESPLAKIDTSGGRLFDHNGSDITPSVSAVYNSAVWGMIPKHPRKGQHWGISARRHGYFPDGKSMVTLISVDARTRELRLALSGSGTGPSENDLLYPGDLNLTIKPLHGSAQYRVRQIVGRSSWVGNLTIRNGLVFRENLDLKTGVFVPSTALTPSYTWLRKFNLTSMQISDKR